MKRFLVSLLVFAGSMAVIFGGSLPSGEAFTSGSISISGEQWTASFIPSNDDTGTGRDYFCVVCYNADGTLDDIDIRYKPTGLERVTATGPCNAAWGPPIAPISAILVDAASAPTGISEDSSAAAGFCGVPWNPPGGGGPTDSDGDGVVDGQDLCPNTPAGTPVDATGCPLPPPSTDDDGDGVLNGVDQCPNTPPGTAVNAEGCPDEDGDGVRNGLDLCPGTPAGTPVDANGCPVVEPPPGDSDGDGVNDALDLCPNTPAGTAVDANGCPVVEPPPGDSDGDGVVDGQDLCPNTLPGTTVGADGCPVVEPPPGSNDGDGDGVPDRYDQCPSTPAGTPVTRSGCARVTNTGNPPPVGEAGCDIGMSGLNGVGGTFLTNTVTYWRPDETMITSVVMEAGKSAKVLGMDSSGKFYQVIWNCNILWVPAGTIGPNYDSLWNGAPLPTNVTG